MIMRISIKNSNNTIRNNSSRDGSCFRNNDSFSCFHYCYSVLTISFVVTLLTVQMVEIVESGFVDKNSVYFSSSSSPFSFSSFTNNCKNNANYGSTKTAMKRQQKGYFGRGNSNSISNGVHCLSMALTPVGPFCPFRSSTSIDMEPKMERMNTMRSNSDDDDPSAATIDNNFDVATEMTKIQLNLQMGIETDPGQLIKVADQIESSVEVWENLVTRLKLSSDFQTREYAKLTQAHLETNGVTTESVASMMRWQAGCMKAMANNQPPPIPPSNVNIAKMMEDAMKEQQQQKPPSITAMAAAQKITTTPFNGKEAIFDSLTVKDEYEALCRDHMNLIEFGSTYDTFDPSGKILYLDETEKIEDRWDVFFKRFQLMGQLNQDYIDQCNAFLQSMGLTEDDYKKILSKSHDIMREDAENERNMNQ